MNAINVASVRVWLDLDPSQDELVRLRTGAVERCVAAEWNADVRRCMTHTDRTKQCLTPEENAALQAAFVEAAPEMTKPSPPVDNDSARSLARLTARVDQICACRDDECLQVLESESIDALVADGDVHRDHAAEIGSAVAALGERERACRNAITAPAR